MVNIVSSFLPFPGINWWTMTADKGLVFLDGKEHFEKMTDRNRYYISGSNGMIQLSIPLEKGRNQRTAMEDVLISNRQQWQLQHWRTLVSVYKRSPYFDYYEPLLQPLYETEYKSLAHFNLDSIEWLKKQLRLPFEILHVKEYIKDYGNDTIDLRRSTSDWDNANGFPPYYQVFSDRTGFLPGLSMLDLLFSEGPYAIDWLKENKEEILKWMQG